MDVYLKPKDVRQLAGCSQWELLYWQNIGLVRTVKSKGGKGSPSLFSLADAFSVFCLKKLKDAGLPLGLASEIAKRLFENRLDSRCLLLCGNEYHCLGEGEKAMITAEPIFLFWPGILWKEFSLKLKQKVQKIINMLFLKSYV